jgi:hypothetical protein
MTGTLTRKSPGDPRKSSSRRDSVATTGEASPPPVTATDSKRASSGGDTPSSVAPGTAGLGLAGRVPLDQILELLGLW